MSLAETLIQMEQETIDLQKRVARLETLETTTAAFVSGCLRFIEHKVADGSSGTITFTSIPGTYRHLLLLCQASTVTTGYIRFNNDSGANYRSYYWYVEPTLTEADGGGTTDDTEGYLFNAYDLYWRTVSETFIFNYASRSYSLFYKVHSFGGRKISEEADIPHNELAGGWWGDTSAVTRIDIIALGGGSPVWLSGSRFTLYGLC